MKKSVFFAIAGMVVFASCSKDFDFSAPEVTAEQINENVEKVFGVTFDPNQDWCTTQSGKVTISFDNAELRDVEKVQILTVSPFGNSDANGAKSLNEKAVSYGQSVTLYYDAPKMYNRLYAACVTKDGKYFIKGFNVGQEKVVFTSNTAGVAKTRSAAGDFDLNALIASLPAEPVLNSKIASFGNERTLAHKSGWSGYENEYLYAVAPEVEAQMCLEVDDYSEDYKTDLYDMIFNNYLQNKKDNINLIRNSEYYMSNNNYPFATGGDPIILAPVYKNDGGYKEIENCDIYYYYFNPEQLKGKSEAEQVQFLKNLPKYKAVELWTSIKDPFTMIDNQIKRQTAYALIYWGDNTPVIDEPQQAVVADEAGEGQIVVEADAENQPQPTKGSYIFPKGYRIGFMLRSVDSDEHRAKDGDIRDGELYCDGRLNNAINKWGHFASAKMKDGDPRMAWFWANDRNYLCCESGSDRDINDVVFEVLGGLMVPPPPTIDKNMYTFCFEDQRLGDYDLNDVVIRAYRQDATTVVWKVVACGAHDEVFIKNINGDVINEETEVHAMFDKDTHNIFINTENKVPETPFVVEAVPVPENFSFLNEDFQPFIYDKTRGYEVHLAVAGQDPHAIMVPYDFRYPLERICVKNAYSKFNSWGQGAVLTDDENGFKWYLTFDENKVTQKVDTSDVPSYVVNQ